MGTVLCEPIVSQQIQLHDLAPSPNNMKVRLALGYKKIAYDRIPVDPAQRSTILRLSGQPLTPLLVHDDRVIFDSGAILRYLDANFPETPRLFSADREKMKKIESYEHWARHEPSEGFMAVVGQMFLPEPDMNVLDRATVPLAAAASRLEKELTAQPFLMGEELSAADLFLAPLLYFSVLPQSFTAMLPPAQLFIDHYRLPEGHPRVAEWVQRVVAFDRKAA